MTKQTPTKDRRTVLQVITSGLAASIAGCLDSLPSGNTPEATATPSPIETRTASATPTGTPTPNPTEPTPTEVDSPATPDYLNWMFAPGLMDYDWPISVYSISPTSLPNYREQLNSNANRTLNELITFPLANTHIVQGKVTEIIGTRDTYVLLGDFTQREVDRNRVDRFERKPPEYRGFLLYENSEDGQALAAKDGVALATEKPGRSLGPMNVLKRIIDTGLGDSKRLVEARPEVDPLASWLGDRTVNTFWTHPPYTDKKPQGMVGTGVGWTFTEDAAEARYVVQFETASAATDSAIDTWLDQVQLTPDWEDTTRNHHGEIVVIDGTVTYDEMLWES